MSILKVARMGHPVLRTRARALDKAALRNPALQKLIGLRRVLRKPLGPLVLPTRAGTPIDDDGPASRTQRSREED